MGVTSLISVGGTLCGDGGDQLQESNSGMSQPKMKGSRWRLGKCLSLCKLETTTRVFAYCTSSFINKYLPRSYYLELGSMDTLQVKVL